MYHHRQNHIAILSDQVLIQMFVLYLQKQNQKLLLFLNEDHYLLPLPGKRQGGLHQLVELLPRRQHGCSLIDEDRRPLLVYGFLEAHYLIVRRQESAAGYRQVGDNRLQAVFPAGFVDQVIRQGALAPPLSAQDQAHRPGPDNVEPLVFRVHVHIFLSPAA